MHCYAALNIIGLVADVVGAALLGSEVWRPFRGQQFGPTENVSPVPGSYDHRPTESDEHRDWERTRKKMMNGGLVLLFIGFVLQLCSAFLQL
jgi:hypothetical protein